MSMDNPNIETPVKLEVTGIPGDIDATEIALYRSRIIKITQKFLENFDIQQCNITIQSPHPQKNMNTEKSAKTDDSNKELSTTDRAKQYFSIFPYLNLPLILSDEILDNLHSTIQIIRLEKKIFDEWGLREIEPFPRSALNFHGPPGTGKTLAAHYLANKLEKKVLIASYAQIESKYHGDGPKNVDAIFFAAERDDAILFIDEADSLLSKRLLNVTQGSEQAINSMRSQLLICLERFKGIVIFATNLVENYDHAFETRVKNIPFSLPDEICRKKIWEAHLPKLLPIEKDVSLNELAKIKDLSGRDIKNAVIDSAVRVATSDRNSLTFEDILISVDFIKNSRIGSNINAKEKKKLSKQIKKELDNDNLQSQKLDNDNLQNQALEKDNLQNQT